MTKEPDRIRRPTGAEHHAPSRRGFMGSLLGGFSGFFVLGWIAAAFGYMSPRKVVGKKAPQRFLKNDLPKDRLTKFEWGADVVAVFWQGDRLRAFNMVCTHMGCIVDWEPGSQEFVCPCHKATFDKDGKVVAGPPPLPLEELKIVPDPDDPNAVIVGAE